MSAVSSSAGALQIVKLYVQIKMWSVQDKNKDGHQQHRLISGLRVEVWQEISLEGARVGVCNSISWQLVPVSYRPRVEAEFIRHGVTLRLHYVYGMAVSCLSVVN